MAKKVQEDAETPVSSMLDVVFLLLIFFIVTSKDVVPESYLSTNLPAPSPPSDSKPPPVYELVIDVDGSYIWSPGTVGAKISYEELARRVGTLASGGNNDTMVFIKVKKRARADALIRALDLFNQGKGMKNLNLTPLD